MRCASPTDTRNASRPRRNLRWWRWSGYACIQARFRLRSRASRTCPRAWRSGGGRTSAFGVLLRRPRLELKSNEAFVAYNPGVVTGLDDVCLAWTDLLLRAVLVDDMHPARLRDADMP